jgi:hypothetical protein
MMSFGEAGLVTWNGIGVAISRPEGRKRGNARFFREKFGLALCSNIWKHMESSRRLNDGWNCSCGDRIHW